MGETRSGVLRNSSTVQVLRSSAEALQNGMQITAYCAISSCIYGHIFVLNLHSTCAAPGEDSLAILDSILLHPSSHLSLFFLISPFSSVISFLFLYETRPLVSTHLLFLCVLLPAPIPF
jgi:hypothetical protein